jgi:hypothetical protein
MGNPGSHIVLRGADPTAVQGIVFFGGDEQAKKI